MKDFALLPLLVLTLLGACGDKTPQGDAAESGVETVLPDETNKVTVVTLQAGDFHHELISNGKLSARRMADLRFESAEPIARIFVKNGERVTQGQRIAELATFRLANKTAQAKGTLDKAELELKEVLVGQGYSLADTARVPAATLRLAKARSGYDLALAQYELARYEEQNATLTAPFEGVIANLSARQANIASTTEAFCTVIDPRSLEASFTVLESELPLIHVGDKDMLKYCVLGTGFPYDKDVNPANNADNLARILPHIRGVRRMGSGWSLRSENAPSPRRTICLT